MSLAADNQHAFHVLRLIDKDFQSLAPEYEKPSHSTRLVHTGEYSMDFLSGALGMNYSFPCICFSYAPVPEQKDDNVRFY